MAPDKDDLVAAAAPSDHPVSPKLPSNPLVFVFVFPDPTAAEPVHPPPIFSPRPISILLRTKQTQQRMAPMTPFPVFPKLIPSRTKQRQRTARSCLVSARLPAQITLKSVFYPIFVPSTIQPPHTICSYSSSPHQPTAYARSLRRRSSSLVFVFFPVFVHDPAPATTSPDPPPPRSSSSSFWWTNSIWRPPRARRPLVIIVLVNSVRLPPLAPQTSTCCPSGFGTG